MDIMEVYNNENLDPEPLGSYNLHAEFIYGRSWIDF